ncbi:hypothetical protein K1719_017978 [Acacia pycnantha]|nr:hypothetical protein K1719_017978 [Acacia pycnantha]
MNPNTVIVLKKPIGFPKVTAVSSMNCGIVSSAKVTREKMLFVDQPASLFAECVIAEALPVNIQTSTNSISGPSVNSDVRETSILAEIGRMQVVLDASDGIC